MPFTISSPDSVSVPVETTADADTVHITSIFINMNPNDASQTSVEVHWCVGAVVNGTFCTAPNQRFEETLSGADLLAKMVEATNDGETHYESVKRSTYELLQSRGLLPAGTVT